jgi:surfactin synthase thioesterase subunit
MKLYTFHFAGGNKYSYNKILPEQGIGIEVPRISNTSFEKLVLLNTENLLSIKNDTEDYVLYGHSMGALVAFLVCHRLKEMNHKLPEKLILSGKKSPSLLRDNRISHLPNDLFWQEIVKMGGIPDEISNCSDLVDYYLPFLKYDFTLIENYHYKKKDKLKIPMDIFYGSEEATMEDMVGWKNETTETANVEQLEGNHFFIYDHANYFKEYFTTIINNK